VIIMMDQLVYRAHVFTSTGTFTVSSGSDTVEYLVVAGGGGGGSVSGGSGYSGGGGGGAGGFRTNVPGYPAVGSAFPVSEDLLVVEILLLVL
jgi:hypothetical protein